MPAVLNRVGIIGDVHAEDVLLTAAIAFLRECKPPVDALLCTGDIVDGTGNVDRCCAVLEEAGVQTVRGNHDRWLFERGSDEAISPEALRFLRSLPVTREFETPRGRLLLCHGLGDDDLAWFYPEQEESDLLQNEALRGLVHTGAYRYMVNGHTHVPMVRSLSALTILNAGTLQWAYGPCFHLADFDRETVTRFALDADTGAIRSSETLSLGIVPA